MYVPGRTSGDVLIGNVAGWTTSQDIRSRLASLLLNLMTDMRTAHVSFVES